MREGAQHMADGHHRICCVEVVLLGLGHGGFWFFVLILFPSMGEIQIMCDMYMDKVGIPMLVKMSKQ